jgi:hypothetical protein
MIEKINDKNEILAAKLECSFMHGNWLLNSSFKITSSFEMYIRNRGFFQAELELIISRRL